MTSLSAFLSKWPLIRQILERANGMSFRGTR
jgi:hypothetical protein